jgi:L,D-transpeptidase ErfK/SrfK
LIRQSSRACDHGRRAVVPEYPPNGRLAPSSRHRGVTRAFALAAALTLGGCRVFVPQEQPVEPVEAKPALPAAAATHLFPFDPQHTGVVGVLQATHARAEDTLSDIARRFDLGFDEVVRANPGVDPWLPGEGTRIVLPTQFVLPDAKPEGIVVNVAAMRLFYFPKPAPGGERVVITHPIGIGKIGWATPVGATRVVSKRKDPWWTPPESVRREHEAEGDPLPARVPPGPDNPLGARAMNLGWPSYLIHGTNKPAGVGLRASHGCIRMYPEDIAAIYDGVPVGTKVTVVNQPLVYRWQGDSLYVQAYPSHEDARKDTKGATAGKPAKLDKAHAAALRRRAEPHGAEINWPLAEQVASEAQGMAVPVSLNGQTFDGYVAQATLVDNSLPQGSNWDGRDDAVESETATVDPAAPDSVTPGPVTSESATPGPAKPGRAKPGPAAAPAGESDVE